MDAHAMWDHGADGWFPWVLAISRRGAIGACHR